MTTGPSVLIVGGGTMGLAAASALASRGSAVTVLERQDVGHDLGSHSGFTRVFRHAYHEGSFYVPLAQESDDAWVALGKEAGEDLLVRTGLLEFGPLGDGDFHATLQAVEEHGLEHEMLDSNAARERWPIDVPPGWQACFTPSGGYLRVLPCLTAMRRKAEAAGASIRVGAHVTGFDPAKPEVTLEDGTTLTADRIVIAAGTGLPSLCPGVVPGLRCLRRFQAWTTPAPEHVERLAELPVWAAFVPEGFFYGFPYRDEGVPGLKLAVHRSEFIADHDDPVDPETVHRGLLETDVGPLEDFMHLYFEAARGEVAAHRVCLYCATPSWNFVVDRHPAASTVVIAGGFSGHGFKFAPAIGRLVSELALDDADPHPAFALAAHGA